MIILITLIYIASLLGSIYYFILFILGSKPAYDNLLMCFIVAMATWGILIAVTLKKENEKLNK